MAVIGGGPAGSAAALVLASAGVPTLVVDRCREEPGARAADGSANWKIGETLPPAARDLLQGLGLWERFLLDSHLPAYGNRSAWGADEIAEHHFIFDPYGPGWHLDRARFDEMLRRAASEAGAVVRPGERVVRVAGPADTGADWRLELEGAGGPSWTEADVVIDATGRASWLSRSQGGRRKAYDRLLGVAARLRGTGESQSDSMTLVEAAEGGWWYSAPVPEAVDRQGPRLIVAYFTDADLLPSSARQREGFQALLALTSHTRRRATAFQPATAPRVVSAASSIIEPAVGDSWLAVGDAAASHDPLSSQGICTALASGRSAALAVLGRLGGDNNALAAHARLTREAYARYLVERAAYYALERRWPRSSFWRRRSPRQPHGGTRDGSDRLLRHSSRHRDRAGRQQPDRVLRRA